MTFRVSPHIHNLGLKFLCWIQGDTGKFGGADLGTIEKWSDATKQEEEDDEDERDDEDDQDEDYK
jgi:hypothetical protein